MQKPVNINIIAPHASIKLPLKDLAGTLHLSKVGDCNLEGEERGGYEELITYYPQ
jgi:hypothetical protein